MERDIKKERESYQGKATPHSGILPVLLFSDRESLSNRNYAAIPEGMLGSRGKFHQK